MFTIDTLTLVTWQLTSEDKSNTVGV